MVNPLLLAMLTASCNSDKPFIVAFETFIALLDPKRFVRIFFIPACSMTARTAAPAITPVPGGVGPMTIACLLSNTLECFKAR